MCRKTTHSNFWASTRESFNESHITNRRQGMWNTTSVQSPMLAESRSSASTTGRLLWRNFWVLEEENLKLWIWQKPPPTISSEQTLKFLSQGSLVDPKPTLETEISRAVRARSRLSTPEYRELCELDDVFIWIADEHRCFTITKSNGAFCNNQIDGFQELFCFLS